MDNDSHLHKIASRDYMPHHHIQKPSIAPRTLLTLMSHRHYGVEYQPIIKACDSSIFGYEALARFYDLDGQPLPPQDVFSSLHDSPLSLFQVEYDMKQLQIQHAPNQGFLFMNLDQDAYAAYGDLSNNNPMVELVSRRDDIVLEIIENTNISDATISQAMALAFSSANVRLALDDIGAPDSMLSLPVLLAVNYLKLDRSWLAKRDAPAEIALLRSLIEFAHLQDKQLVLEGVETAADFQFAREFNVDFVQGFMYRELFQSFRVN